MTTAIKNAQSSTDTQTLLLPKRTSGASWEVIEQKLGITRTADQGAPSRCNQGYDTCEVIVPGGWRIVESGVSCFQHHLVDESGKVRAKLFYKTYRADFIQLIQD